MSDVFISYSREDKDFVGKLQRALDIQGLEIWIDWESIPPSQEWWEEIQKGIIKTSNFVVVLSPNSMASPICQLEIEYAREVGKRIIPIHYLDYSRDASIAMMAQRLANPEQDAIRRLWQSRQPHDVFDSNDSELKSINYFFFAPDDDFQARVSSLTEVIRTDYAHKEQHANLELRAQEWLQHEKNTSFLLIYDSLIQAQAWLETSSDKIPPPTSLQLEFIVASEKRTRQLRRIQRISVGGGLVAIIAIIIAIGASLLGARASGSAKLANTKAAGAGQEVINAQETQQFLDEQVQVGDAQNESKRLAALANEVLTEGFSGETAALLSIRALQIAYTPEADAALRSAQYRLPLMELAGHTDDIRAIAVSPDSQYVLTGSEDETAQIWDIRTGKTVYILEGHEDLVRSVAFSPDGRFVATGSWDNTARIWNVKTGDLVHILDHSADVYGVVFSPDSAQILTFGDGDPKVWDTNSGTMILSFDGHDGTVDVGVFSIDGQFVLTGGVDRTAQYWNIDTGETRHVFEGHQDPITSIAISPDGRFALTGSFVRGGISHDNFAQQWDLNSGDLVHILRGHSGAVRSVGFSPDSQYMLTGSSDDTMRLWSVETGETIRTFAGYTETVGEVLFSPDGSLVISGSFDGTTRIWDRRSGELLNIYQSPRSGGSARPVMSPDGNILVTIVTDPTQGVGSQTATVWRVNKSIVSFEVWDGTFGAELEFSHDDRFLLAREGKDNLILWDLQERQRRDFFAEDSFDVVSADFSPIENNFVTAGCDGILRVWDLATETVMRTIDIAPECQYEANFSPDGRHLLTMANGVTSIVDMINGVVVQTYPGTLYFSADGQYFLTYDANVLNFETLEIINSISPNLSLNDFAVSLDGKYLLNGTASSTFSNPTLWDIHSGQQLFELTGHSEEHGLVVNSNVFTPNGERVITGSWDGTARVWSVETGKQLHVFNHSSLIEDLAISPDGAYVVTASCDDTAVIWSVETGKKIDVLDEHTDCVQGVAFSHNGQYVATVSDDGSLRLWNIGSSDELIESVCAWLSTDLTEQERQQYDISRTESTCTDESNTTTLRTDDALSDDDSQLVNKALTIATTGVTTNSQWEPYIQEFDGIEMVLVPAGCFMMGSNEEEQQIHLEQCEANGDSCNPDYFTFEMPQHQQCFSEPFWIDRTEVTQADFDRLGGKKTDENTFEGDSLPVESILWPEAFEFCQMRGLRLPTEREWEYAARGPDSLIYPWGNTWNPAYVVWRENALQEVGGRPASWVGALDMIGNVAEFTSTTFGVLYWEETPDYDFSDEGERFFGYPYDHNDGRENQDSIFSVFDYQQVDENKRLMILVSVRGGSYIERSVTRLRASLRGQGSNDNRARNFIGLRCARDFDGANRQP